jgi:hypothetical protein
LKEANYSIALKDDAEAKIKVAAAIDYCFALCKTYGKTSEDMEKMQKAFVSMLGEYPHEKVIKAFRTHVERSDEIPTLASIISLIRRNGKPLLLESDIIAIRKKHDEDKTSSDWDKLREWQDQQDECWEDAPDSLMEANLKQENRRLRQRIADLEAQLMGRETHRVIEKQVNLSIATIKAQLEKPLEQKIQDTADYMRRNGASEKDILEFLDSIKA